MTHIHKPLSFNTSKPYPAFLTVPVQEHLPQTTLKNIQIQKALFYSFCIAIVAGGVFLNPAFLVFLGATVQSHFFIQSLVHTLIFLIPFLSVVSHKIDQPQKRLLRLLPSSFLNARVTQDDIVKIVESCLPDIVSKTPNGTKITFLVEMYNQNTKNLKAVVELPKESIPIHFKWDNLDRWVWVDFPEKRGPRGFLYFEWDKTLNAHTKLRALARS